VARREFWELPAAALARRQSFCPRTQYTESLSHRAQRPSFSDVVHAQLSLWLSISAFSTFSSWRIRLQGAEKGSGAPGGRKKLLPGAEKNPSAPGGRKKLLPGAKKSLSAPGGGKKLLSGAKKSLSAPGGRKKLLPGAEKNLSAPGGRKNLLSGEEKGSGAPGVGGCVCVGGGCFRGDVGGRAGLRRERARGERREGEREETAVGIVAGFCYFCVTEPNL